MLHVIDSIKVQLIVVVDDAPAQPQEATGLVAPKTEARNMTTLEPDLLVQSISIIILMAYNR